MKSDSKKINLILKNVLERIKPSEKEIKILNDYLKKFIIKIYDDAKKKEILCELFIGGSFAKNTVVARYGEEFSYDIDLFIRYDKKYLNQNISEITENLLKNLKIDYIKLHGSRDYFRINSKNDTGLKFYIEIIPVMKVKNPKESSNITDLSYSHVNYIKKKIKNKKILDEIILAKQFAFASNCYGAESYIKGFSGYGLELLVYKYGSFYKFIKEISKLKDKEKLIIDFEKHYKNKNQIMLDINSSKLQSPIILVDPVYKQRNVLAALNEETFNRFKNYAREFLKKPGEELFELKKIDIDKIKEYSKKKKHEFIEIEIHTDRQEGDIAGSKLLKFYNLFGNELEKYFEIKDQAFFYDDKKSAKVYFSAKKKKEILIGGPNIEMKKNADEFKKVHKNYFIKNKRLFSKEKVTINLDDYAANWKEKNRKIMKDMSITDFKILN